MMVKVSRFLMFSMLLNTLALSGCIDSKETTNILDKEPVVIDQKSSHIAFPDAVSLCEKNLIAYRIGDSHASDRGYVAIGVFKDHKVDQKLTVEDSVHDIRNPYFVIEGNDLLLYVTVYDYTKGNNGFLGTRLYKVSSRCDLLSKPILLKNVDWHVVYAPVGLRTGSFSKIIRDREWCISIFDYGKCDLMVNDEEMALLHDVYTHTFLGVLRNHPRVGLPLRLMAFDKEGENISSTSWCPNNNQNSALVSPKVYSFNNKYYVLYAEREVIYKPGRGDEERGAVWVKVFNSIDDLRNCRPASVYKTPDATSIDMGYPSISFGNEEMTVIWYETNRVSTGLFSSSIEKISK